MYFVKMVTFEEYLAHKKIDSEVFKSKSYDQWSSLKELFDEVHPNSFTAQKLFLINKIRRLYPLRNVNKDLVNEKI